MINSCFRTASVHNNWGNITLDIGIPNVIFGDVKSSLYKHELDWQILIQV